MGEGLPPNTILSHYRVLAKIGEGGMGEVYLARDESLDRQVALKILPANVASDAARMRRFVREAKSTSSLNHPSILTIYEIGAADAIHFIATEYVEGETLRSHLSRSLTLPEVLDIGIQVAGALAAAHGAGVIHRDVKPENIMLRRDGIAKVLDFGLAKLEAPEMPKPNSALPTQSLVLTNPGAVIGTVSYMSPEQARGISVDARTDIFSLGVVLYEMVAGCRPSHGSTASEVLAAILARRNRSRWRATRETRRPSSSGSCRRHCARIASSAIRPRRTCCSICKASSRSCSSRREWSARRRRKR